MTSRVVVAGELLWGMWRGCYCCWLHACAAAVVGDEERNCYIRSVVDCMSWGNCYHLVQTLWDNRYHGDHSLKHSAWRCEQRECVVVVVVLDCNKQWLVWYSNNFGCVLAVGKGVCGVMWNIVMISQRSGDVRRGHVVWLMVVSENGQSKWPRCCAKTPYCGEVFNIKEFKRLVKNVEMLKLIWMAEWSLASHWSNNCWKFLTVSSQFQSGMRSMRIDMGGCSGSLPDPNDLYRLVTIVKSSAVFCGFKGKEHELLFGSKWDAQRKWQSNCNQR